MSSGRERFAFVGMSKSGDLCNLLSSAGLRSNFIIYEDAADYTQLWAKEV